MARPVSTWPTMAVRLRRWANSWVFHGRRPSAGLPRPGRWPKPTCRQKTWHRRKNNSLGTALQNRGSELCLSPLSPGTPGERGRGEGAAPSPTLGAWPSSPSPPTPLPRSTGGEGRGTIANRSDPLFCIAVLGNWSDFKIFCHFVRKSTILMTLIGQRHFLLPA